MEKINIFRDDGHILSVYLVRYFCYQNNVYFIYTLQEKDDKDYMKLYVVKVMKELGNLVTQTIRRPDEWNRMKNIVKCILSEIKNQRLTCIQDLDYSELQNIIIHESRSFHIATDLVNILVDKAEENENIEISPISSNVVTDTYREPKENIEVLSLEGNSKDVKVLNLIDSNENNSSEVEIETLEL